MLDTGGPHRIALKVDNTTSAKMARKLRGPRPGTVNGEAIHTIASAIVLHLSRTGSRFVSILAVAGELNQMADALSRQQLDRYHALAREHPGHHCLPT